MVVQEVRQLVGFLLLTSLLRTSKAPNVDVVGVKPCTIDVDNNNEASRKFVLMVELTLKLKLLEGWHSLMVEWFEVDILRIVEVHVVSYTQMQVILVSPG